MTNQTSFNASYKKYLMHCLNRIKSVHGVSPESIFVIFTLSLWVAKRQLMPSIRIFSEVGTLIDYIHFTY